MRTIKMGNKEIGLRATPLALLFYQQDFKTDLLADLASLQKMAGMVKGDFSGLDSMKILQLIYAMHKADSFGKKKCPDFVSWLSKLDSIDFADQDFITGIVNEAIDGFFRSAGNAGKKQKAK